MPLRVASSLLRPATTRTSIAKSAHRALSTSPRLFIKEDAERSPEQVERKKQEQLEKQKRGEGHWHEELGSQSESHIAADKENVQDHNNHMSKLQEQTKKKGEKGEL